MKPKRPKKARTPRSPLRVTVMETASILLALLAVFSIAFPVWLAEQSGSDVTAYLPYGMAASVLLLIPSLILIIRVWPDQQQLTYADARKRVGRVPLSVLPGVDGMRDLLRRRKFDEIVPGVFREGWLTRRPFFSDRVMHYILFFESGSFEEASAALPGRIKAAWGREPGPGLSCIIPVLCQQEVTEQDRAALKEQAAHFYARASAGLGIAVVPVLVERRSRQGWYLARRWPPNGYDSGCWFLRWMEKQLQKNAPGKTLTEPSR